MRDSAQPGFYPSPNNGMPGQARQFIIQALPGSYSPRAA